MFEDLISDSSVFQEKILKFLNLKTLRLPSNEFVSNWIKKDPVNNNNDLYISTPSKKKDEVKKIYRDKVETHFLKKIANKLYIKVINNE